MTALTRQELRAALDALLQPSAFRDYAPNGLQVEGGEAIARVVTGVSANQALLDAAIEWNADAIVVHHGWFWKNEPREVTGIRARRLGTLLANGVSLFAYHLPLDAHPEVGNNAQLLRGVGLEPTGTFPLGEFDGLYADVAPAVHVDELVLRIGSACGQPPTAFLHGPDRVRRVAVCTGGGAGFFEAAVGAGADLYLTGEPAERSAAEARELGAHFVAAGHHATERFGPRAIGDWIADRFPVEVRFVDVPNPV